MKKNEKVFKTDAEYFADTEYLSNSMLKNFITCPNLFKAKFIDKTFEQPEEEKDYFIYGRAVDTILTESREEFENKFLVIDRKVDISQIDNLEASIPELEKEISEKEKEGKAHKGLDTKLEGIRSKLKTLKSAGDKTQMTTKFFSNVDDSVRELLRQPLYNMFGVGAKDFSQEVIALTINGVKRKGKLDYINVEKKIILDVKTTRNLKIFDPRMYAGQLNYYGDLAEAKYGIPKNEWDFYLAVVDKHPDFKRSEIMHLQKNLINAAGIEQKAEIQRYAEETKDGFFSPITSAPDAHLRRVREEVCFDCPHYKNCEHSLQKEISVVG